MRRTSITDSLFRPLSDSLAQLDWTVWDICAHLEQRLPPPQRKHARVLAEDLKRRFPATAAPDGRLIARHLGDSPAARPLVSWFKRTNIAPDPPIDAPVFRPGPAFESCDLPALATPDALADWLGLSPLQLTRFSDLRSLSARTENVFAPHYLHHLIPKPDQTLRLLEEPKPVLKHLQRRILQGILSVIPPHPAAYGFCPGKTCIQAAARHAGEAMVVCFDLSGFFPSIAQHRVYGLFRSFGYPAAVARHLAGLCTAVTPPAVLATPGLAQRDRLSARHLPQGAPTSPALANLAAFNLDTRLAGLARSIGAAYTRYADDMTFSGDRHIALLLQRALPEIVNQYGFALNPIKTRARPAHTSQRVTGIVVNRHLNLPRRDYDQLKAVIHHLRASSDPRRADPVFLARIEGRIAWLEQLNPAKGARLRARLADALHNNE